MRIEPPPSLPWATGQHPGGDRGRRAARGAAGRAVGVPRVARRAAVARLGRRQDPELGHVRDADDHEARLAQAPHEVGAVIGAVARRKREPKFMHRPSTGALALTAIGTPANGRSSPGSIAVGGPTRARRRPRRTRSGRLERFDALSAAVDSTRAR